MKYACLNPIAQIGLDGFGAGYVKSEDPQEAELLLVRSADMHEMEISDDLLAVGRAGAGVNNIPLDKMADRGVVVFNSPGANANGVKELVICGMLLASRDIIGGIGWIKDNASDPAIGKSAEKAKKAFAGTEIKGKTLGVIGLGAIGAMVSGSALALGMDVIGYDPYLSPEAAKRLDAAVKVTENLDDIYASSDYITIHVPALESTKGMINAEAISKMKTGVIFLNFARDLLVNENDMAAALAEGKVRRYVSDFPNAVSANMPGAIVTPHLGASTEESEDNSAIMAVSELKAFAETGAIKNSVNFPRLDAGEQKSRYRLCVCTKGKTPADLGLDKAGALFAERGEYGYMIIDTDEKPDEEMLNNTEGVTKTRIIFK